MRLLFICESRKESLLYSLLVIWVGRACLPAIRIGGIFVTGTVDTELLAMRIFVLWAGSNRRRRKRERCSGQCRGNYFVVPLV